MIAYAINRDGKTVAHAVTLPNGKCVVSWPTSTIVYDSEDDARRVHVDHMSGRGQETVFDIYCAPKSVVRGWEECYQDQCEGVPLAAAKWTPTTSSITAPEYIEPGDASLDWCEGYAAMAAHLYGTEWRRSCRPKDLPPQEDAHWQQSS